MNKITFHIKKALKVLGIFLSIAVVVSLIVLYIYRPTYEVYYKEKFIGYSRDIFNIKERIHESIFNGDSQVAYYELEEEPTYEFKFIKSKHIPDDQVVIAELKEEAKPIYKSYAVKEEGKTKAQVATYKEAKNILDDLKKKDSNNLKKIEIEPTYTEKKPEIKTQDKVVAQLYEKKPEPIRYRSYAIPSRAGSFIRKKQEIPVTLRNPISRKAPITARFGDSYAQGYPGPFHSGVDIGIPIGTPVRAAAAGTVTAVGSAGSYGEIVEINHGEGVYTLYAHLNSAALSVGTKVEAGTLIAYSGNTGYSSGPHLHFEVKYNGSRLNPENYCNF